jgi:hypothetical protein
VHDQREETTKKIVVRIRALASKGKQMSDRRTQTYECLLEDLEIRKLEA